MSPKFFTKVGCLALAAALLLDSAAFAAKRRASFKRTEDTYITTVMKKAAYDFESIQAGEKRVESAQKSKRAVLLNSFSVSGGISHTKGKSTLKTEPVYELNSNTNGVNMSVNFTISLATWLNMRQSDITIELQRSALRALQMQLAKDAARYYLDYGNSSIRIFYLEALKDGFVSIKKAVDDGKLVLNDANRTLLDSTISGYDTQIAAERNDITSSAAVLEKYLGHPPSPLLPAYSRSDFNESRLAKVNSNEIIGIDFEELDKTFVVPATAQLAFQQSQKSPALIDAQLQQKLARNLWYLTMASAGPMLTLSLSRNYSYEREDAHRDSESYSATASLGFQIGAGLFYSLRSNELLEEAARLDERAQRKNIKANLIQLYTALKSSTEQLHSVDETFRQLLETIRKAQVKDNESFTNFLSLVSLLDSNSQLLTRFTADVTARKIDIHGQIGTLLEAVDKEEARLKKRSGR